MLNEKVGYKRSVTRVKKDTSSWKRLWVACQDFLHAQCTTVTTHNTIDNTLCQAANTHVQRDKQMAEAVRQRSDRDWVHVFSLNSIFQTKILFLGWLDRAKSAANRDGT